jgi:hypothetical protein
MSKNIIVIGWVSLGFLVVGTLGLAGYYITINEPVDTSTDQQPQTAQPSSEEITDALSKLIEDEEKADLATVKPGEATATLDSLRENGNEFAIATRAFNGVTNKFELEVLATLGDAQPGGEYVVFITDGVSSLRVGTLGKEVENTYALSYISDQDISELNEISIIESGASVKDVLQGFFEQ